MESKIKIKLIYQNKSEEISLKREDNLNDIFKNFLLQHNFTLLKSKYYFYLIKNKTVEKELPNEKKISELDLNENDEILISDKKLQYSRNKKKIQIEISECFLLSDEKENDKEITVRRQNIKSSKNTFKHKKKQSIKSIRQDTQKDTEILPVNIKNSTILYNERVNSDNIKKKFENSFLKIILSFISFLTIIGIIILIIIFLFKPKKKKPNEINFKKDNLIIQKKYVPNLYMRFMGKKESSIIIESKEIKDKNSSSLIYQVSDFIFIIRDKYIDKDTINEIEKEWYTGYIDFMKITLKNKTNDMTIVYDKTLNNYLNKNDNKRMDKEDFQYIGEEGNISFVKLDFYQNGEIKNYYIPNNFSIDNFAFIEDIARLMIPKISSNLYVKSINDTLNGLFTDNITDVSLNNIINSKRRNIYKKKIINPKFNKTFMKQ